MCMCRAQAKKQQQLMQVETAAANSKQKRVAVVQRRLQCMVQVPTKVGTTSIARKCTGDALPWYAAGAFIMCVSDSSLDSKNMPLYQVFGDA